MMIPNKLKNKLLRFCRVKKGTKKPFEQDWTKKPYFYQEIEKFEDENYGVLCGYGDLAVIDCDNKLLQNAIEQLLPETYKVKTGSGGTHNYYFIKGLNKKMILETEDGTHLGEIQSWGTQVVGPKSIHPNGLLYEELNDINIQELSYEEMVDILKPFLKEFKEVEETAMWEKKENDDIDNLSITDIFGTSGLKKHGSEYYGEHPIHGSDGGMNFWINPSKNLWHCFRCDSGGGPLSAIAVKEGIIDCSDARKGNLRGEKVLNCIKIAEEKYGLKKTEIIKEVIKDHQNNIEIIWDKDLQNYKEEEKEWIIDKLIPNRSVCVLTGKRGTLKTFITLQMGYCIASGKDFLGKFPTKIGGVLYLDKENGVFIMKKRVMMIKKGLEIENIKPLSIGFICFSQLKIDRLKDIKMIEELIKEHHPKVLIIDTYRRGISFDENDAGAVSELFVDILRPLVEKNNLSIILIHHNRKGMGEGGDEMDEIRGSSDLANYSDIIIKLERKGNMLIFKQLKNRNAQEEQPIQIKTQFNEDLIKMEYEGLYEKKNQESKCSEILLEWIIKNNLKVFKTQDAGEVAFTHGIKKNAFYWAIDSLQSNGIIVKSIRGVYTVDSTKL